MDMSDRQTLLIVNAGLHPPFLPVTPELVISAAATPTWALQLQSDSAETLRDVICVALQAHQKFVTIKQNRPQNHADIAPLHKKLCCNGERQCDGDHTAKYMRLTIIQYVQAYVAIAVDVRMYRGGRQEDHLVKIQDHHVKDQRCLCDHPKEQLASSKGISRWYPTASE